MDVQMFSRFFLPSLLLVSVAGLEITNEVEKKTKKIGEDAVFSCVVENYHDLGNINIAWYRTTDVETVLIAIDDVMVADDTNVKVEFSKDPKQSRATSSVSITKLQPNQFGSYLCSLTGKDYTGHTQMANIKIEQLTRWLPEVVEPTFGKWHLDGSDTGDKQVSLFNGAKYLAAAPFQHALFLQGGAYARIKRAEIWNADFTVHLYIQRGTGHSGEYQTLLGSWDIGKWMFLFRVTPGNQLLLELRRKIFAKGSNPAQTMVELSGGNIEPNQWYSVAFSWERLTGAARIYIDGVVVAEEHTKYPDRNLPKKTSTTFQIGYKADSNAQFFEGYMAELTIYHGVLPLSALSELAETIKYQ